MKLGISSSLLVFIFLFQSSLFGASNLDCLGPFARIPDPVEKIKLSDIETMRFSSFNLWNLGYEYGFWKFDSQGKIVYPDPKRAKEKIGEKLTERKLAQLEMLFRTIDADVYHFQEILLPSSLIHFGMTILRNKFNEFYHPGNDRRIALGSTVKADFPFSYEVLSFRDVTWIDPVDDVERSLFSRDLPVKILYGDEEKTRPLLILAEVHHKSQIGRKGDKKSSKRRMAQVRKTGEILDFLITDFKKKFGYEVPTIVFGDFNEHVPRRVNSEMAKFGFSEALELANIPTKDRITHVYIPKSGKISRHQLDAVYFSEAAVPYFKSAHIQPHLDEKGRPLPLPKTYQEKLEQVSDHLSVVFEINFEQLLKDLY